MKHSWFRTGIVCMAMVACGGQAWSADTASSERPGAKAAVRPTGPDVVTLNFVNADVPGA